MTVMDEIRKLDEKKASLLQGAKQEALDAAKKAIATLAELGFNYQLVASDGTPRAPRATGTRRTGIRDDVLNLIRTEEGLGRADILEKMGAKGNKSAEQSISNALAALKKAGTVTAEGGAYKAG